MGNWIGFINEAPSESNYTILSGLAWEGVVIPLGYFNRFAHLVIIPSIIGSIYILIDRLYLKKGIRKMDPVNAQGISALNFFLQLVPAILGMRALKIGAMGKFSFYIPYFGDKGDPINATWLSDLFMVPIGYSILALMFIIFLFSGVVYVLFSWLFSENKRYSMAILPNVIITSITIYLSYVFIYGGMGIPGILQTKYKVNSISEYVAEYGFISLFYNGPVRQLSHFLIVPGLVGSFFYYYSRIVRLMSKIKNVTVPKNSFSKRVLDAVHHAEKKRISKLGMFGMVTTFLNIIPAALGFSNSTSWLSDFVGFKLGLYAIFSTGYVVGIMMGYLRILFDYLYRH